MARIDLTGFRTGYLTVIRNMPSVRDKSGGMITMLEVRCDCGKVKTIAKSQIKGEFVKSCGCKKVELSNISRNSHGFTNHPLFKLWASMFERCYKDYNISFRYYGGRGIKMCDEWKNNKKSFFDWALINGWSIGLQIDRFPDKNGDYEPNNCRFVTPSINCRNRRNNVIININGKEQCATAWAIELGILPYKVFYAVKSGKSMVDFFNKHSTTPR